MHRRKLLISTGAAASIALAGCSAFGSEDGDTANGGNESEGSPDETALEEIPETSSSGNIEFNFSQMYVKEYLRYYDEEADSVSELYPERDFFIETSVTIQNLGGDSWEPPAEEAFELVASSDGESAYLSSLPGGVTWDQIRLRDEHSVYWIDPDSYNPETVEGGEELLLYMLYDATESSGYWMRTEINGEELRSKPGTVLVPDSVE